MLGAAFSTHTSKARHLLSRACVYARACTGVRAGVCGRVRLRLRALMCEEGGRRSGTGRGDVARVFL